MIAALNGIAGIENRVGSASARETCTSERRRSA